VKTAFSQPTPSTVEQELLFTHYRDFGYGGLQLKYGQYGAYITHPEHFLEQWGVDSQRVVPGLIAGGSLDEEGMDALRAIVRFARVVGSERVIFCHDQPRRSVTHADLKHYAALLSRLGKEALDQGVSVSLHHHYNQPVMYRQDFEMFFEAVEAGSIRLTVDTAHLVKSGIDDIAGVLRDYRSVLDNIHIKDIKDGAFTLLGQGSIDFAPVFAELRAIDYQHWVCADEESGSGCLEAMEVCARFLARA
jgi:sugar phosphate isomerase/epimerase